MSRPSFKWEDPFLLEEQLTEEERMVADDVDQPWRALADLVDRGNGLAGEQVEMAGAGVAQAEENILAGLVQREALDLAAQQVIEPRLGNAAVPGGDHLCPAARADYFGNPDHQFGPQPQVLRFARITLQRVPDTVETLWSVRIHGLPPINVR